MARLIYLAVAAVRGQEGAGGGHRQFRGFEIVQQLPVRQESRACPPRYTLEVDFKDYAGALNADMAGAKSGRPAAMAESRNQPC